MSFLKKTLLISVATSVFMANLLVSPVFSMACDDEEVENGSLSEEMHPISTYANTATQATISPDQDTVQATTGHHRTDSSFHLEVATDEGIEIPPTESKNIQGGPIGKLPSELWPIIADFLSYRDIVRLNLVNQSLHTLSQSYITLPENPWSLDEATKIRMSHLLKSYGSSDLFGALTKALQKKRYGAHSDWIFPLIMNLELDVQQRVGAELKACMDQIVNDKASLQNPSFPFRYLLLAVQNGETPDRKSDPFAFLFNGIAGNTPESIMPDSGIGLVLDNKDISLGFMMAQRLYKQAGGILADVDPRYEQAAITKLSQTLPNELFYIDNRSYMALLHPASCLINAITLEFSRQHPWLMTIAQSMLETSLTSRWSPYKDDANAHSFLCTHTIRNHLLAKKLGEAEQKINEWEILTQQSEAQGNEVSREKNTILYLKGAHSLLQAKEKGQKDLATIVSQEDFNTLQDTTFYLSEALAILALDLSDAAALKTEYERYEAWGSEEDRPLFSRMLSDNIHHVWRSDVGANLEPYQWFLTLKRQTFYGLGHSNWLHPSTLIHISYISGEYSARDRMLGILGYKHYFDYAINTSGQPPQTKLFYLKELKKALWHLNARVLWVPGFIPSYFNISRGQVIRDTDALIKWCQQEEKKYQQ